MDWAKIFKEWWWAFVLVAAFVIFMLVYVIIERKKMKSYPKREKKGNRTDLEAQRMPPGAHRGNERHAHGHIGSRPNISRPMPAAMKKQYR